MISFKWTGYERRNPDWLTQASETTLSNKLGQFKTSSDDKTSKQIQLQYNASCLYVDICNQFFIFAIKSVFIYLCHNFFPMGGFCKTWAQFLV